VDIGMMEKLFTATEKSIARLKKEIAAITDYSATIKKRKAEMKESVDLIEQIIQEGAISDANLRLLVDSIVISEKDKKLHIKINLNAKFERHKDCYDEEGNLTESERIYSVKNDWQTHNLVTQFVVSYIQIIKQLFV
jgi:hypothetical protein